MHPSFRVISINALCKLIKERQANKFDVNILITGDRGDGKSQTAWKIMKKLIGKRRWLKKAWDLQVYSRDDMINLLKTQKMGYMWSDETIEGGFNRDWAAKGQKDLIKLITKYRNHYNISIFTMPIFKTLDVALKDLIFCHIHVYERGSAAIFLKPKGYVYSTDLWRTKECADIEKKWEKRRQKDPSFELPYHELPTFEAYLEIGGALSKEEEEIYETIKNKKKGEAEEKNKTEEEKTLFEKLYERVINGEITREGLQQISIVEGIQYKSLQKRINDELKKHGEYERTLFDFIKKSKSSKTPDVVYVEKNKVPVFG